MNWAWTLPLKPTTKLVLMSLSDVSNDLGECFPSVRYIADRCCISKRHTRREIQKLVELGLMNVETRFRGDGSNTSNLYVLSIPYSPKIGEDKLSPPNVQAKTSSIRQERVTPASLGGDEQTSPLTTIEPSNNQTTTTTEYINIDWPENLSQEDKSSIEKIVVGVCPKVSQKLLNELAGQLDKIKRPVAYFYALLQKHQKGLFVPSCSTQVENKRVAQKNNAQALEHSTALNIQRLKDYGIDIKESS